MKLAVVVLALVTYALATPVDNPDAVAEIVRSDFQTQPEGSYEYSFETSNKISRQETGEVKDVLNEENKPQSVVVVRGSYSYPGSDGKPETINYFADETGYHAEGASIPKSP